MPISVFIKRLSNNETVKAIDVERIIGTTNYERFMSGLFAKTDTERFWIDSEEADKAHDKEMAKR